MPVQSTGPGTLYVGTTGSTTIPFTSADVWAYWNTVGTTSSTLTLTNLTWAGWNTVYQENADQRAERERREEQARADAELAEQRYRQAVTRGEELLLSLLSDEQAASRRDHGYFTVRGSRSGAVYRIHSRGISNNVDRLDDGGRREMVFCAHPPGLCAPDVHLAQMLALVTDEDAFLAVANSHRVDAFDRAAPVPAAA
jgi:hypothetical protein